MLEKQTCNFQINCQSNFMSPDLWWISVSNCKCSVTTSENHCTQTTSPAIHFCCNWTTSVWYKANYDISLACKRQQNLSLLQTAAWKVLNWIAFWNEHWTFFSSSRGPGLALTGQTVKYLDTSFEFQSSISRTDVSIKWIWRSHISF